MVELAKKFEQANQSEYDLNTIILGIKEHRLLVFTLTLLTFLMALVVCYNIPTRYTSIALIDVGQANTNVEDVQLFNVTARNKSFLGANDSDIQLSLITSRYVLQPVIDKLHLNIEVKPRMLPIIGAVFYDKTAKQPKSPWLGLSSYNWGGEAIAISTFSGPALLQGRKFFLVAKGGQRYLLLDHDKHLILEGAIGRLENKKLGKNSTIMIKVNKLQAYPGSEFVVRYLSYEESYRKFLEKLKVKELQDKTGIARLTYTDVKTAKMQKLLNAVIESLINKDVERKIASTKSTLKHLRGQLALVNQTLSEEEKRLTYVKQFEGTADVRTRTSSLYNRISHLEEELSRIRKERADIESTYTSNYPAVITAKQKERQMQEDINKLQKQIESIPQIDQKFDGIIRTIEANQKLYTFLLSQIKKLEAVLNSYASPIQVLTYASPPEPVSSVIKILVLMIGVFMGLILSSSIIAIKQALNKEEDMIHDFQSYLTLDADFVERIASHKAHYKGNTPLLNFDDDAIAAQDIQSLCTRLHMLFGKRETNIVKIIGLVPDIGRSFICANLASLFSRTGKKTLLIDLDVCNGKVDKYYGLRRSPGAYEIIKEDKELDGIVKPCNDNLDVIPAGKPSRAATEILMNPKLDIVMNLLSQCYDVIVVSAPAMTPVVEGEILASKRGINVLVIEDTIESYELAHKTTERLHKNEIDMDVILINQKND